MPQITDQIQLKSLSTDPVQINNKIKVWSGSVGIDVSSGFLQGVGERKLANEKEAK